MASIPTPPNRPAVRIGPGSAGLPMTPAEFDVLPPSRWVKGHRYELINGVLVVTPPPGVGERSLNDYLGYLLTSYREGHGEGSVIDDTLPEQTVAATNRRRADRVVWTHLGRRPDELTDVPSIVIEFVSARRRDALRDHEIKRDEYLTAGVREYWIIDRFRRIMTVYHPGSAGPTCETVPEDGTYRTDLLPGFVLPLSSLLSRSDRWEKRPEPRPQSSRRSNKPTPPSGGTDG